MTVYGSCTVTIGTDEYPVEHVAYSPAAEEAAPDAGIDRPMTLVGDVAWTGTMRITRAWRRWLNPTRGQRRAHRRHFRGRAAAIAQRTIRSEHRRGNHCPVAASFVRMLVRHGAIGPGCWETIGDYQATMRGRRGKTGGAW